MKCILYNSTGVSSNFRFGFRNVSVTFLCRSGQLQVMHVLTDINIQPNNHKGEMLQQFKVIKNQHFIEYFSLLQTSSECEMHLSAKYTICPILYNDKVLKQ